MSARRSFCAHRCRRANVAGSASNRFVRALSKTPEWLSSAPRQSYKIAPFNALAVAILVYVVYWGRKFDPWLRLFGATAIAQHSVVLFYVPLGRYHFLTWFLTMLVFVVFIHDVGSGSINRLRYKYRFGVLKAADRFQ
jgi:hypothetical protein